MVKLYSKKRVNFGKPGVSDLPRYEFHRSVRQAIEVSATSFSHQEVRGGMVYQWDNIAPEVALVIMQDAQNEGIAIQQEVIKTLGVKPYNEAILQAVIDTLNANADYALFTKKLALRISKGHSSQLTMDVLSSAGITTEGELDQIFTDMVLQEKKLGKNYPNFSKIKKTDDYQQLLDYLASNPVFDKFLRSFTDRIAYEYNKGRPTDQQVTAPASLNRTSLADFLKAVSYSVEHGEPKGSLKKNTLYVEVINQNLQYTVMSPTGEKITDTIPLKTLGLDWDEQTSQEQLNEQLPAILAITAQRGHTGDLALHSTEALKIKGYRYLAGEEVNHDVFLSYLPAIDLVKDEKYKFTLYRWLEQPSNLNKLKDQLVKGACQRLMNEVDKHIKEAASLPEIPSELKEEINQVGHLLKEMIQLVASLDNDLNALDEGLDKKIRELKKRLLTIKEYYSTTPIAVSGLSTPTTAGNFEHFVKRVLFHSASEKVMQIVPNANMTSKALRLDLMDVVQAFIHDRTYILARDSVSKKEQSLFLDEAGELISPAVALRNGLKANITTQLKSSIHHYHAIQSYQNDKLSLQQAPLSFRGGNLTNSLAETKSFAKKMTREGEYSADSHLLIGQENNLHKHEVRSGAAATLIAATGVDGTRSVTDKFTIAIDFGGQKDVKILYVLRGKPAFHTQSFIDPFGKNKLSEIAYTHITPDDYVMTVIYDKNNVILDVIPGNLNGEIEGVSDFSQKVLAACLDFYNQKHNTDLDYKAPLKLPEPDAQTHLPTGHLYRRQSFIDILRAHQKDTGKQSVERITRLGTIRIERAIENGHKKLKMQTLQSETSLVSSPAFKLQFNQDPFPRGVIELEKERETAVAHYNMRHILTLKGFTHWTKKERKLQEEFNRILQPDFMEGDIQQQLAQADVAQEGWLTDVLVPTINTALLLHVAARLITDYQIDIEEVNECAQMLCQDQEFISSEAFSQLNQQWKQGYDVFTPHDTTGVYQQCLSRARLKMTTLYPHLDESTDIYSEKFEACMAIERNKIRKQVVHQLMSDFLDKHMDNLAAKAQLAKKPVYKLEDNQDFVFLGPAASGKSTISRQYVSESDKVKYVSLATDDYRGICKPNTQAFEQKETDQVFIRTQDSAYLVGELVEARLKAKKEERPNVIVDGVTYKSFHRELVEKNSNSVIVCACLDNVDEVVKRCYARAIQEDSGSADKGRHVNTTSLLDMHKTASINLIAYCPENTVIKLYNTNIPKGQTPPLIATLNTMNNQKTLTITQTSGALVAMASFFNKSRLNSEAKNTDSLFIRKMEDPSFKIDSLFATMDRGFKIVLNGEESKPCIILEKKNGVIIMDIVNPVEVKIKLMEKGPDTPLLNQLILYGELGSLRKLREECLLHPDMDKVVLDYLDKRIAVMPLQKQASAPPGIN
ncbi:zeta toxin family protein [Legionella taurinensis]|nr:zeta toxin family protein [Legionella taurinensis]STY26121.1 Zeta toxin [Legionella taurinensis]